MTATSAMASIFQRASKVLVLDPSLYECDLPADSEEALPEETLFRIGYSKWTQRLWTLQEGVFEKDLYFQFRSGAVTTQLSGAFFKKHFEHVARRRAGVVDAASIT